MKKFTKSQLVSFRRFRDSGMSVGEARRLAMMTYNQLATELSERLNEIAAS